MGRIHSYHLCQTVAIVAGAVLIGTDTVLNAEHTMHVEGTFGSLTCATIAATLGAAAALPLAERALGTGHLWKSLGLGLFFLLMVAFSVSASLDRVGSARDGTVSAKKAYNASYASAARRVEDARQELADARAAANQECVKRGPKCRDQEAKVEAARSRVADAEARLSQAGAPKVEDSSAVRIVAAVKALYPASTLTEVQVQLFQPLILPIGLQVGGFSFLALGFAPQKKATRGMVSRKTSRARKPKRPKPPPRRAGKPNLRLVAAND